jgi:hypothetical protein
MKLTCSSSMALGSIAQAGLHSSLRFAEVLDLEHQAILLGLRRRERHRGMDWGLSGCFRTRIGFRKESWLFAIGMRVYLKDVCIRPSV